MACWVIAEEEVAARQYALPPYRGVSRKVPVATTQVEFTADAFNREIVGTDFAR